MERKGLPKEFICFSFSTGFLFVKKKKCCVNVVKSVVLQFITGMTIVAEGKDENIRTFIARIKIKRLSIDVESVEVRFEDLKNEFDHFEIKRGDWQEELAERLDAARTLLFRSVELMEKSVALSERSVELSERAVALGERTVASGEESVSIGKQTL